MKKMMTAEALTANGPEYKTPSIPKNSGKMSAAKSIVPACRISVEIHACVGFPIACRNETEALLKPSKMQSIRKMRRHFTENSLYNSDSVPNMLTIDIGNIWKKNVAIAAQIVVIMTASLNVCRHLSFLSAP